MFSYSQVSPSDLLENAAKAKLTAEMTVWAAVWNPHGNGADPWKWCWPMASGWKQRCSSWVKVGSVAWWAAQGRSQPWAFSSSVCTEAAASSTSFWELFAGMAISFLLSQWWAHKEAGASELCCIDASMTKTTVLVHRSKQTQSFVRLTFTLLP